VEHSAVGSAADSAEGNSGCFGHPAGTGHIAGSAVDLDLERIAGWTALEPGSEPGCTAGCSDSDFGRKTDYLDFDHKIDSADLVD